MKNLFEYCSRNVINDLAVNDVLMYETVINNVSTAWNPQNNTLIFCESLSQDVYIKLQNVKDSILILSIDSRDYKLINNCVIYVDRPRKYYSILLTEILNHYKKNNVERHYVNGYCVSADAIIGENTVIEPFAYIGSNVSIGKNCKIRTGAKILDNIKIGNNCVLKENCVVGSDGFGVERDLDGTTYKIPHVGGVKIGDNVEIGALTAIAQGTIEPTTIDDNTKIDDTVFIAHNARIGKSCFLIANSEISGSVVMGDNCWIAPNSCIKDHVTIGSNVTVGMGAVVLKDVVDNSVIIGNPGKELK